MLSPMSYLAIKSLHMLSATIAICGFIVRGYWMMTGSAHLEHRVVRIAPHVVDTVFLLSGIAMVVMLSINPFAHAWLVAKFAGLVVYVLLGTIAIKRGPTREIRVLAFAGAVSVFAYIVGVALSKSAASWLAFFS